MTTTYRALYLVVCCILVTACSSTRVATRLHKELIEIEHWGVQGRIAISTVRRSDSVRFHWSQKGPNSSHLKLTGPLGWGSYDIRADPATQSMELGTRFDALPEDQQTAIRQQLSKLPLHLLSYWLRGLPLPEQSTLSGEYQVVYEEYQQVDGYKLPRKMRFSTPGVEGKLLLKNWQIQSN